MFFDKRCIRYFDWFSFCIMSCMIIIGLMFVFSATYKPDNPISLFFKKQVVGVFSGYILYFFFSFKDLRNLSYYAAPTFYLALLLLGYTIIGGWVGMGAQRWLSLYFIRVQPAEAVKFFLPLFIAHYFSERKSIALQQVPLLYDFRYPLIVTFITFCLIIKQPDLGTGLIVLMSAAILFWFIGIGRIFLIICGVVALVGAPVLWVVLKPYQQQRIKVLFGYGSVKGERYQIEQSKIAIGSGGILGKGFLRGTQSKLAFLPEDHTDFIFSVICEEFGFLGALVVMGLFMLLFLRIGFVLCSLSSLYLQIIGLGLFVHVLLAACVNMGMVTGLLPIVGIPLPLFSYGISNLWITMISFGWLNNIAMRRFYI